MIGILKLFWTFFKIGLFTFGGGYAMIPLIEQEIVGGAILIKLYYMILSGLLNQHQVLLLLIWQPSLEQISMVSLEL